MEISKKEKAIEQAEANLKVDGISLSHEFLISYRVKNGIPIRSGPQLIIKKGICNGKK